jgi:hypothetical protein
VKLLHKQLLHVLGHTVAVVGRGGLLLLQQLLHTSSPAAQAALAGQGH